MFIHPQACISEGARIGANCTIEAFAFIGPEVILQDKVHVKAHGTVTGQTEVGEETVVFPYACVGEVPQDLKYKGEKTTLKIGKRNRIREGATLNMGTDHGGGITEVGDDCLFMTGAHVGHDVSVGNNVILANQVALGGHCILEDNVIIGGLSGVHQFVRIGRGAFVGAVTLVRRDVIPYGMVDGPDGSLKGLNLVGLRRRKISREKIEELRKAYSFLVNFKGSFADAVQELKSRNYSSDSLVNDVIEFALFNSGREFLKPS